jgi:hypothetical protein
MLGRLCFWGCTRRTNTGFWLRQNDVLKAEADEEDQLIGLMFLGCGLRFGFECGGLGGGEFYPEAGFETVG